MAEGECLWKFHDLAKLEDLFLDQLPLTTDESMEKKKPIAVLKPSSLLLTRWRYSR